jgi:hypothetical protein
MNSNNGGVKEKKNMMKISLPQKLMDFLVSPQLNVIVFFL